MRYGWRQLIVLVCLACAIGCGGGGSAPSEGLEENRQRQTVASLESMKQLADAIEKKDAAAVSVAVEGLISNTLDVKSNPEAAKELVSIYNSKVKGKLKGEDANQVNSIVSTIESQLK